MLLTYNLLAFPTLCAFYYTIDRQNITEQQYIDKLNAIKEWCGFTITKDDEMGESWIQRSLNKFEWTKRPETRVKVGNFLIAYGMLRILSPVYLGASAMLVPRIAKRIWR